MPKKKGHKNCSSQDFTVNDYANAPKPTNRLKKSAALEPATTELSWDKIDDEDLDIVLVALNGTNNIAYNKRNNSNSESICDLSGNTVPEIVWYHVSEFIKPEDVGRFARINKATYAITKRESFWRLLYKKYCQNSRSLPEKLHLENSFKAYGLRQRVIRALYHTYKVFIDKVMRDMVHDSRPHSLVKRICVNVWFNKELSCWRVFFKFKKLSPGHKLKVDFLEELGRIDANPDEDTQVMQVNCQNFSHVPPLMGMVLSSVAVELSQGFRHHRLSLGFNSSRHVPDKTLPECSVVIDTVLSIQVFDWWHPRYPHFDNMLPLSMRDEESLPVLKKGFFDIQEDL